jgi:hypothetical protein
VSRQHQPHRGGSAVESCRGLSSVRHDAEQNKVQHNHIEIGTEEQSLQTIRLRPAFEVKDLVKMGRKGELALQRTNILHPYSD